MNTFRRFVAVALVIALGSLVPVGADEPSAPAPKTPHSCPTCKGATVCVPCDASGSTKCGTCSGRGKIRQRCSRCGGDGRISTTRRSGGKTRRSSSSCSTCSGRGYQEVNCAKCGGDGKITCEHCKGEKVCPVTAKPKPAPARQP